MDTLSRRNFMALTTAASVSTFTSELGASSSLAAEIDIVAAFDKKIAEANARLQLILSSDNKIETISSFATILDLPGGGELVDHAWQLYASALRAKFTGGAKWPNLQLVTIPETVRWDDPDYSDYYLYTAGNDMPQLGVSRRPTTRSFVDEYSAFINDIAAPIVDNNAKIQADLALKDASAAQNAHFALEQKYENRWEVYDAWQKRKFPRTPSRWKSIDDWYAQNANAALNADTDVINVNFAKAYALLQQAYGGQKTLVVDVLLRFNSFAKVRVKIPKASDSLPDKYKDVYPYEIKSDFPKWLSDARAGGRLAPTTFMITAQSDTYDYSKTDIAGAVGIGFGFFGIIAGGERVTIQVDTTHQKYQLGFDGQVAMFEFAPGDWYNSIALTNYRAGPFASNSQMDRISKTTGIFGSDGILNFRSARYIVAYKPKVSVTLEKSDYHYFYQQTRGVAGFFIGPFVVGVGGYYSEEKHIRWDSSSSTITIYDGPDLPQLLAVDCDLL